MSIIKDNKLTESENSNSIIFSDGLVVEKANESVIRILSKLGSCQVNVTYLQQILRSHFENQDNSSGISFR
jgi:hypothetical protein